MVHVDYDVLRLQLKSSCVALFAGRANPLQLRIGNVKFACAPVMVPSPTSSFVTSYLSLLCLIIIIFIMAIASLTNIFILASSDGTLLFLPSSSLWCSTMLLICLLSSCLWFSSLCCLLLLLLLLFTYAFQYLVLHQCFTVMRWADPPFPSIIFRYIGSKKISKELRNVCGHWCRWRVCVWHWLTLGDRRRTSSSFTLERHWRF